MELTKKIIETSLLKAIQIFKDSNIGIMDNDVEIEYLDSDEFLKMISNDDIYNKMLEINLVDNLDKDFPIFFTRCTSNETLSSDNKTTIRKSLGIPYEISVDFNKAKKLLRPFSRDKVEKFLITIFLSDITSFFEESVKEMHSEFYNKTLKDCDNDEERANISLHYVIGSLYGYQDVKNEILDNIFSKILFRINNNNVSDLKEHRKLLNMNIDLF